MSIRPLPNAITSNTYVKVPEHFYDKNRKVTYAKGKFLGRGGSAKCFQVLDPISKQNLACKVVNKALLKHVKLSERLEQEITIHQDVKHANIVSFHSYFEDEENVYIMLELCSKNSLMEMLRRRKVLTEIEVRYFLRQITLAVQYLHEEKKVVHRDLKLRNIFINEEMIVKVGDFGLATHIQCDGHKLKTLCGTPNYLAPEVLAKRGYSYEADVFSIGCILYTLLVGRPPFEANSVEEIYAKIRRGDFLLPLDSFGKSARFLIEELLQLEPTLRPTCKEILGHAFLTADFIPTSLPIFCLTTPPRFKMATELNSGYEMTHANIMELMKSLKLQITDAIKGKWLAPSIDDEIEDPSVCPMLWITKWVDYSDKYGFGYKLSDGSIGVNFNDQRKLILNDLLNVQYIERSGKKHYYSPEVYDPKLEKKMKLLSHFDRRMKEECADPEMKTPARTDCIARLPNLWTWARTPRDLLMVLSNGSVQINNIQDHTKMILCPLLGAVTTIQPNRPMRTFKLSYLKENGLTKELSLILKCALEKVEMIISNPPSEHQSSSNPAQ